MNETLELILEALRMINRGQEALSDQLADTIELLKEKINNESNNQK